MAFCTNCGAPMEGQFCTKCGARAGAAPPAGNPPATPAADVSQPTPQKKGKVLKWVLLGCGGLIVLALIAAVGLGLFVRSRIGDTRNPGFAAAKLMASMNPNVEVVSADEDSGKITLRDKRTGKTVTLDFQEIQKGNISFEGDNGEKVEIRGEGQGEAGSVTVESKDGKLQIGQGSAANVPAWVPKYPGAQATAALSSRAQSGQGGTLQLKCSGSVRQVADYYEQALKGAGMKVEQQSFESGGTSTVLVSGSDDAAGRSATVTVTSTSDGTVASVVYKGQP